MEGETAADRIKARHSRANFKKGAVVKQRDGTTVLADSLGAARTSKAVVRVADAMATLDSTKVSGRGGIELRTRVLWLAA